MKDVTLRSTAYFDHRTDIFRRAAARCHFPLGIERRINRARIRGSRSSAKSACFGLAAHTPCSPPRPEIEFQEILIGAPVPKVLDWSYAKLGFLDELKDISPFMFVICALIFISLWLVVVNVVNSTFRPISINKVPTIGSQEVRSSEVADPGDAATGPPAAAVVSGLDPTSFALDRIHLEQAIRVLFAVGLPVLAVWYVTGAFGNEPLYPRGRQTISTLYLD